MRSITLVFISLLITVASPVSGPAFDLDSLLIQSIGGLSALETARNLRSLRVTGSIDLNGQPGRFVEIIALPNRIYLEVTLGQVRIVQAYDGVEAWQRDLNGHEAELTGFERKELLRSLYFESFAWVNPGQLPGDFRYRGDSLLAGQEVHCVEAYPMLADTVQLLFDRQTGLRRAMLSRLDNLITVTTYFDYRSVGGLVMPFQQRTKALGAPLTVDVTADTVQLNVPVNSSMFSRADTGSPDMRFPAGRKSVQIPFTYHNGHIYVTATINGRKQVRLILDSGSSATIFHEPAIEELALPKVGSMPTRGVGGFATAALVQTDSIEVGGLIMLGQVGGTLDLSALPQDDRDSVPFGGMIGYDFLSRLPVEIDYKNKIIIAYSPVTFRPPTKGHTIGFDLTMQVPTVTVELAGVRGRFLVDLGNAFDVIIHEQFAVEHGLEQRLRDAGESDRTYGGIGGGVLGKRMIAPRFTLGTLTFTDQPVILSASSSGISGSVEIDGNIGNGLLQTYRVVLDYARQQLHLIPVAP